MNYACVVSDKNMADHSELVAEAMSEDQLVDMWSDYPCLYDVRSTGFKNRLTRESIQRNSGQVGSNRSVLFIFIIHVQYVTVLI